LPAMKKVAIKLRLDLAQYREVASFAQLTSDLDPAPMKQLHRGERLVEVLKQPKNDPMPVEKQVCILWAVSNGHLDDLALNDIARFQTEWFAFLDKSYPETGRTILATGKLSDGDAKALEESVVEFKKVFVPSSNDATLDLERATTEADAGNRKLQPEAATKTA
jgi:F-type H+/Na+-transporting ATPase subunit alpha